MMTPRDWTALGLRLIGVYFLLSTLSNAIDIAAVKMHWWERSPEALHYYLFRGAVYAVVGLALARKAESVASFLLGTQSEVTPPDEGPSDGPPAATL